MIVLGVHLGLQFHLQPLERTATEASSKPLHQRRGNKLSVATTLCQILFVLTSMLSAATGDDSAFARADGRHVAALAHPRANCAGSDAAGFLIGATIVLTWLGPMICGGVVMVVEHNCEAAAVSPAASPTGDPTPEKDGVPRLDVKTDGRQSMVAFENPLDEEGMSPTSAAVLSPSVSSDHESWDMTDSQKSPRDSSPRELDVPEALPDEDESLGAEAEPAPEADLS